jgi:hypothetical protein
MAAALLTASPDAVPSPTTTARKKRLTDKTIERLRPPAGGRLQIPDSIITGLWLRVTASGVKSWSVLYRMPGRKAPQRLTLGKHPGITCGAARKLAREVLIEVAAGRDPAAAKRSRRYQNGDSFEQVAEEWLARQVRGRLRSGRPADREHHQARRAAAPGRRDGRQP